jgi:hypothetical protein
MDGDLPKREWLDAPPTPRAAEGGLRTVLLGRSYGADADLPEALGRRGIGVEARQDITPDAWVRELSRYDAGWLHGVRSRNGGDIRAALWDDLNLPARIPTLVAAGLPLIVPRPPAGAIHAAARLATEIGCGVLYEDLDDLAAQLGDRAGMARKREAAWAARETLTFDHHADRLVRILEDAAGRA